MRGLVAKPGEGDAADAVEEGVGAGGFGEGAAVEDFDGAGFAGEFQVARVEHFAFGHDVHVERIEAGREEGWIRR